MTQENDTRSSGEETANAIEVTVTNRTRQRLPLARLQKTAESITAVLGYRNASIGILLTTAQDMRQLSAQFRSVDHATNVLSFSYTNTDDRLEGDVVLCVPVIQDEAHTFNRSFHKHLFLLLIHAMLHITGLEHATDKTAHRMEEKERTLAKALSLT